MFNCGKPGHLKTDYRQGVPRNIYIFFSREDTNGIPHPSGKWRTCGKGLNWTNEYWSIWDREGNPLPLENSVRGLSQVPLSNLVQSIPVTIGKILHRLIKDLRP